MDSPHKGPGMRKAFLWYHVIMDAYNSIKTRDVYPAHFQEKDHKDVVLTKRVAYSNDNKSIVLQGITWCMALPVVTTTITWHRTYIACWSNILNYDINNSWSVNLAVCRNDFAFFYIYFGRHFADDIFRCILWMRSFAFRLKFHWNLFLRVQLTIAQQWFR